MLDGTTLRCLDPTNILKSNSINFGTVGGSGDLRAHGQRFLFLSALGDEYARFNSASGNLSIGNTNNIYKLDVSGTGRFTGILILAQYTTATRPAYVKGSQFFDTTINKMVIGGATAWEVVTSS